MGTVSRRNVTLTPFAPLRPFRARIAALTPRRPATGWSVQALLSSNDMTTYRREAIDLKPLRNLDDQGPSPEDKIHQQPGVRKVFAAAGIGLSALLMLIAVALVTFMQVIPRSCLPVRRLASELVMSVFRTQPAPDWPFPPEPPPNDARDATERSVSPSCLGGVVRVNAVA